ncbi:MAG: hypothetical protein CMP65_05645 [Flavobacteriales bacterium]|nr:hypothetical protein [Flavobacteriales bacterium]|tara:strand:+ start:9972 stop:10802 length:831 start_codon:yes stop_codon:yes gene_type:complete
MKIFFFLLIPFLLLSQDKYVGVITLNDNSLTLPFFLKFDMNKDKINGYSITNYKKSNETKNRISGHLNKETNEFKIFEKEILSTDFEESIDEFCFLTMTIKKDKNNLTGTFIGNYSNGDLCAEGYVYLIKEQVLNRKIKKIEKHASDLMVSQIDSLINYANTSDSIAFVKLTHEQEKLYNFSDSFSIAIWDKQREDGDTISIYINNELYLDKYCIKNKPHIINFPNSDFTRNIKIIANNTGSVFPNSVAVTLYSKESSFYVNGRLDSLEYINLIVN